MQNILKVTALSCFLFLAACAAPQMPTYDIGPKPENYKARAIGYIKQILKDPDSMKNVQVGEIRSGICNQPFGSLEKGWVIPVSYNAKNSYGGYGGQEERYVWLMSRNTPPM